MINAYLGGIFLLVVFWQMPKFKTGPLVVANLHFEFGAPETPSL